jgi:hypothetical protein
MSQEPTKPDVTRRNFVKASAATGFAVLSAYTGQRQGFAAALKANLKITPDDLDFSKAYPMRPVPTPGMPEEGEVSARFS